MSGRIIPIILRKGWGFPGNEPQELSFGFWWLASEQLKWLRCMHPRTRYVGFTNMKKFGYIRYVLFLQSCLTLCDPMNCSLPGFSVHGILQAEILEWVAMPSSRDSSQPRDQTHISYGSCTAGRFFTTEPLGKAQKLGNCVKQKNEYVTLKVIVNIR